MQITRAPFMHPVLAQAIQPFAEEIATVRLAEAQVSPDPKSERWCGQQVVEHLILSLKKSREGLQHRLKSSRSRTTLATLLQHIIKIQVFLGSMPRGVPALPSLTPIEFVPQDGPVLAARLLAEAEELSKVLAECRLAFGLRPCGSHPIYGPLRVEEWRQYHSVHCRHHVRQFKEAVDFARKHPELQGLREPELSEGEDLEREQFSPPLRIK